VAEQREQALLHVVVLSYEASHALRIYCLAIAAVMLAVTL